MSFSAGVHEYQGSAMIGMCDAELLGRTLEGGGARVTVSREYYGGRALDEDGAARLLESSSIINMAGARTVGLAARLGIGAPGGARDVGGVPFMIVFRS